MLQLQYRKEFELIDLQYSKETIRHTIQTQTAKANSQTSTLRRDHSRELVEIQRQNTDIINNMRSMMESKREDLDEQVENIVKPSLLRLLPELVVHTIN